MNLLPNKIVLNRYVNSVLEEDITYSDITTESIATEDDRLNVVINSRKNGIICGIPFALEVYSILDPSLEIDIIVHEGQRILENTDIMKITGSAKAILTGERTALNLLQKASGIATITRKYVDELIDTNTRITDTRKNTPGARLLEKYAIKIGGACPHRYNLSDSILIKDNHIALAGSITEAVRRVRGNISFTTKIEVETENEEQVKEALEAKVDIIMLDNMPSDIMKKMVDLIDGKAIVEASGNISLNNLKTVAKARVDYISTSAITMNASVLDIGMDVI